MARRVLFLAWAPFFSGAERALLLTLRSLDTSRYAPRVLAATDGEFTTQVRALRIPCEVAPLRQLDRRRPLVSALSVAAVVRAAIRHRVSLIHANETPSFQPGGYAARLLGIPAVTHVRFPDTQEGYRWFMRPRFSRAFFVSQALLASALTEAPDVFEGRSEVLHDCVDLQEEWSEVETIRRRRELGLPEDRPIVAMTGQVAEVKGIWDFVEAARILANQLPEPVFVVLGDDLKHHGKTRQAMEARVQELGLSGRFRFLGFHPDAPRLVQAFDVVAVPSHVEPLGNATLEAMAAGRVVVGTRVGGIPEMVAEGKTGLLVPPSDPVNLADAIGRLVRDRELWRRMSTAARHRAAEAFGADTHARKLQARYDRLCTRDVVGVDAESELA